MFVFMRVLHLCVIPPLAPMRVVMPRRLTSMPARMMTTSTVTTISGLTRFEEVIKKSRFVGLAAPVSTPEYALEFVKANSDVKARHNCFAWRLADGSMRTNGDGEPGGTAGPPILAAIDGAGLKDVAVLVLRYRLGEGAKLGTGGLVRAYGGTAAQTLALATTVTVEAKVTATALYTLADTGAVFSILSGYAPRPMDSEASDANDAARLCFEVPHVQPRSAAPPCRCAAALTSQLARIFHLDP